MTYRGTQKPELRKDIKSRAIPGIFPALGERLLETTDIAQSFSHSETDVCTGNWADSGHGVAVSGERYSSFIQGFVQKGKADEC